MNGEAWTCRRCGEVLARLVGGNPEPQMPPVQQVTDLGDRFIFVCACGHVQIWYRCKRLDVDAAIVT